jgi:hypothetical protein
LIFETERGGLADLGELFQLAEGGVREMNIPKRYQECSKSRRHYGVEEPGIMALSGDFVKERDERQGVGESRGAACR